MKNIKPKAKYQSVSLTEDFIAEIKKQILHDPKYKSIADYVREAIREKMTIDQIKEKRMYGDWEVKRNPQNPFQPLVVKKDHRIKLEADVGMLKEEIQKLKANQLTRKDLENILSKLITSKKKSDNNGVRF